MGVLVLGGVVILVIVGFILVFLAFMGGSKSNVVKNDTMIKPRYKKNK